MSAPTGRSSRDPPRCRARPAIPRRRGRTARSAGTRSPRQYPGAASPAPTQQCLTTDPKNQPVNPGDVQRTRAWTGLWVVVAGDVVIALAAIWGVVKIGHDSTSASTIVSILTAAFTAIGTMTTAYF